MAKRRETEPGGIYHVFTRGSNRERIYYDPIDWLNWEKLFARVVREYGWVVLAYIQMPNHFHLVLRTPEDTLSRGMQELNGVHSRKTNARHGRDAHLFRNRFRSRTVTTRAYLLWVLRYIDLNAFEEDLCAHPKDWRWGSHAAVAGYRRAPPFLAAAETLKLFHPDPATAIQRYREFVYEGLSLADTSASQTNVTEL
jgi:REP element-mobilizing transposase RayT